MPPFPTTRWTLVSESRQSPEARRRALEELLRVYWPPLVVYLQCRGVSAEEAQDVVQDLFADLLEGDFIGRLDRSRGRLRGFLKACADHHLGRHREHDGAKKRGGGAVVLALDDVLAERLADAGAEDAEAAFDRRWAAAVLGRAMARLVSEQGDRADLLRAFFGGDPPPAYRDAAKGAAMSVPQLKSFLHRARLRYREILLDEVRETVADGREAEIELGEILASC